MYTLEQLSKGSVVGYWQSPSQELASHNPEAYNAALASAPRVHGLGFCSHCGRTITNNVIFRDHEGSLKVIGETCAEKVGISVAEIAAIKAERAQAAEDARWARQLAESDTTVFVGGKYAGQKIADVLAADERYCVWFEGQFAGSKSKNGIAAATIAALLAPARAEAAIAAEKRAGEHAELLAELRAVRVWVAQQEHNGRWYPIETPYQRGSKGCEALAEAIVAGTQPAPWVVDAAVKDLVKAAGLSRSRKAKELFVATLYTRIPAFVFGK
jgi:hypothetical protein